MDQVWRGISRLSYAATLAGCGLMFIAAAIVTAEVLVRKAIPDSVALIGWLLGAVSINAGAQIEAVNTWIRETLTFTGSDEIGGYLFAVGTSWALSYVLITRGHVRIDVVYANFGARTRAWLDLVALVLLGIFVCAFAERALELTLSGYLENNRSATNLRLPLWWSQAPWLAGIALFLSANLLAIVRVVMALARGDSNAVNAIAGATTQDEEISGELAGLGIDTSNTKAQ